MFVCDNDRSRAHTVDEPFRLNDLMLMTEASHRSWSDGFSTLLLMRRVRRKHKRGKAAEIQLKAL